MKKYKVHFSFFNLFNDSQSEVVKLQMIFKAFTATVTTGTWYGSDAKHALWVGIGGFIIDLLIGCLYFEKQDAI